MKKEMMTSRPDFCNERIILDPENDGLAGIANISSGRYRTNWQALPSHVHEGCLELCLCVRGSLVYECEGQQHLILPNNMFAVQSGQNHHLTTAHKGMRLYWLLFRYPKANGTVLGLSRAETAALVKRLKAIKTHVFAIGDEMRALFRRVFSASETLPKDAFRTLALRTLALQILLLTVECSNNRPTLKTLTKISRIADVIAKRPSHRFSIMELAAHARLSQSRFSSLFRQVVGLPPYAFLAKCRLEAAQRRLAATDDSIRDIAQSCGFANEFYFSRIFSKHRHLPPSEFRK